MPFSSEDNALIKNLHQSINQSIKNNLYSASNSLERQRLTIKHTRLNSIRSG